ncbi:MAG: deoxyguanosinetriphosphate triphosphohydrolase [Methylocella sp.]
MQASAFFRVRAPYAADAQRSRGRLAAEPASPSRSEFQRDRDRIIHCSAFRRLAHKTQVFIPLDGDHYRTRLTHSLEVGQIARALARALGLDDDLAEAIALAHDLGHTPFGHAGEDALDDVMRPYGGFDHNAQTLRIVTKLERRYAAFNGLNLTFETLEGLVKHNGPLLQPDGSPVARYAARGLPAALIEYNAISNLELGLFAGAEAQAAALADDIAYNAHDIDDGLRAGLISIGDVAAVDFLRALAGEVEALYPGLEASRLIHELVRRLITHFIEDSIAESQRRIGESKVASIEEVRALQAPLIGFSPSMAAIEREIKGFLFEHLYRHPRLIRVRDQAALIIRNLFPHFMKAPQSMPAEWALASERIGADEGRRARLVCDYIAGMTDRYAASEHRRIFGDAPDLR